jgi:UMP-CMP kinase
MNSETYNGKYKYVQINAVGTEDEIFEKVRPIFSACGMMSHYFAF